MKLNNIGLGSIVLLLALGLAIAGGQTPNPSKQIYGPGFFPLVLALLLACNGVVLIFEGVKKRNGPLVQIQPWAHNVRYLVRFAAVIASVAFYIICVPILGFLPTVTLLLLGLFCLLGVRWVTALPVAIVTALVVHSLFYLVLRVQLPWGLLEPVRW
jgi:putative tricarboxylic transport membrane protein